MKTATALLVRTIDEPPSSSNFASPDQWVLPLVPVTHQQPCIDSGSDALRARASSFVRALIEVMAGDRPVTQMAAWMSADVYDQLVQRLTVQARASRTRPVRNTAKVGSVHVSMVNEKSSEIAARMVQSGRSRALAIRLDLQPTMRGRSQWRCTSLTWG